MPLDRSQKGDDDTMTVKLSLFENSIFGVKIQTSKQRTARWWGSLEYRVGVRGGEEMKGAWQCNVRLFVKKS